MRRFCLAAITALALCIAGQTWGAEEVTTERANELANEWADLMFHLFAECLPVGLIVHCDNCKEVSLSADIIETSIRSRLRSARLYLDPPAVVGGVLRVTVVVGEGMDGPFMQRMWFEKNQLDHKAGFSDWSPTGWAVGWVGLHNNDGDLVLSGIEQSTDRFLDEYLRVNAEHCSKPSASTSGLGPALGYDPFADEEEEGE